MKLLYFLYSVYVFRKIAKRPDVYELISKSIAPSIYGSDDIKKSIACLLFGGSRKRLPDGLTRRGDINVLLLGDPGTAKSQLLKFVEQVSPIGVYTSGKGSSAAGLTASVIRDPTSVNTWVFLLSKKCFRGLLSWKEVQWYLLMAVLYALTNSTK